MKQNIVLDAVKFIFDKNKYACSVESKQDAQFICDHFGWSEDLIIDITDALALQHFVEYGGFKIIVRNGCKSTHPILSRVINYDAIDMKPISGQ